MQNKNKHESGLASSKLGEAGQVFLIAVLILVIGLTVGLSVASRSVTNLKSSLEEENSQRAFAAAEAGVEKALSKNISIKKPFLFGEGNTAIKEVSIDDIGGNEFLMNGGSDILQNDGADIWLSDHTNFSSPWSSGTLIIGWQGDCSKTPITAPAIEVIVMSGTLAAPQSQRYAFDPCSARQASNKFDIVANTITKIAGVDFPHAVSIPITNGLIARVIPIYADTRIGVQALGLGQSQGKQINSTGTSGGTTRKITYFQGWPKIPNEIFQYVLFQPN